MAERLNNDLIFNRGTSRHERLHQALLPGHVQIDERPISSLLAFAAKFAEYIPYVDQNNKPAGNWAPFFTSDISVFLSHIATTKVGLTDEEIRLIVKEWDHDRNGYGANKKRLVKQLFLLILEMASQMNDWYLQSITIRPVAQETQIEKELEKAIKAELGLHLKKLFHLYDVSVEEKLIEQIDSFELATIKEVKIWEFYEKENFPPLLGETPLEKADLLVKALRLSYRRFYYSLSYIVTLAPKLLESSLHSKQDHDPHVAMLITFLKLFQYAKDHQNTLTERHLDYYFYDILRQKEKSSISDHAHVYFELADHKESYFIEKGTRLLAGINKEGLESYYQTERNLLVTQAKVESLKTIFVSKNAPVGIRSSYRLVSNIYAAPIANSKDGLGAPFGESDRNWPTFGEEQSDKALEERKMVPATIGFVIASPVFQLQEGEREIDIDFIFTSESIAIFRNLIADISQIERIPAGDALTRIFNNSLEIFASGAEEWFPITRYLIRTKESVKNNAISLKLILATGEPSVVSYDQQVHQFDFKTDWPVLRVQLNPKESTYIYSFLKNLEIQKIDISVRVKGLKGLSLYSDAGLLDNSAPFLPFGPVPVRNSYLMIGSTELFSKKLDDLKINIDWNNLPEDPGGFKEYYKGYKRQIRNDSFKVQLSALTDYEFRPLDTNGRQEVSLFTSIPESEEILQSQIAFNDIDLKNLKLKPDYQLRELPEFSNKAKSGFLKLQLSKPSFAFGHSEYSALFADAVIESTLQRPRSFLRSPEATAVIIPKEPFVPVIKRLDVSYTASSSMNFGLNSIRENDKSAKEKIYHIHPFGSQNIYKEGKASQNTLVPNYDKEGYLLIGIKGLKAPQPLTLMFELDKSKKRYSKAPSVVRWRYLSKNEWKPFKQKQLLYDSTSNFEQTGIVGLDIPGDITDNNTILPSGLFWINVSLKGKLDIIGRCREVFSQAVKATWLNNGDESHFSTLQAQSPIKELAKQVSEIAAVHQPYPFFGGRPKERKNDFYMRVSERLRHKNRGISLWDYEHLVLEQFPEIHQVKCIGPSEKGSMLKAGEVRVIVVPRIDGTDLEPKVGYHTLHTIKAFLKEKTSPFVKVHVHNPEYEKIKLICSVLFENDLKSGKGEHLLRLHEEIKQFICPWLKGGGMDIGGKVTKNEIMNFVKERPYIRFVTGLSIVHIIQGENGYRLEDTARANNRKDVIQASSPWKVLIPVDEHQIDFLGVEIFEAPEITSLQNMQVGTDFIILEGEEEIDYSYSRDITEDTKEKGEYFFIEGLD